MQSDVSAKAQECQDFCLGGWVKLIHLQDNVTAWYLLRGEVWGSKGMGGNSSTGKVSSLLYTTWEWLCLQKPFTEEPMLVKLQLNKQCCTECLKHGLEPLQAEVIYLSQCSGCGILGKDALLLQRAGFPMLHLHGNASHCFTAHSMCLSSVTAPGSW